MTKEDIEQAIQILQETDVIDLTKNTLQRKAVNTAIEALISMDELEWLRFVKERVEEKANLSDEQLEVLKLYYGMSESMQKAVYEVMKVTQKEKE